MRDPRARRFLGIQALRIIAACLVVITHSTYYAFERLDKHFSVWERGTRGVDVFFVISGFVMVYSSQKLLAAPNGWYTFAEHRIVRIVPLYWLITSLKVIIVLLVARFTLHTILTPTTAALSYLFLPSRDLDGKLEPLVGVGWTLNFEMLFYLLFTIALFLRTNIYKFVGVLLTLLSIGACFRRPDWPLIAFYFNSIVLEFFLGMLIAKACINGLYISRRIALFLLVIGFMLLLFPPENNWMFPKVLINGLPASLIVLATASLRNLEDLIPRSILYLGDASYSIYLIHPFVCPLPPTLLNRFHLYSCGLSVGLSVLLGVGCGCLLHQLIEVPMTKKLMQYLKRHRESLQAVA